MAGPFNLGPTAGQAKPLLVKTSAAPKQLKAAAPPGAVKHGQARPLLAHPAGAPRSSGASTIRPATAHVASVAVKTQATPIGAVTGSSHSSSTWITPSKPTAASGSSGGSGILGEALGGVEGFIGHLGSDVVHTALGFPVGIAYMIQHPIAGVEGAAKATWNDWSPLFHGNVRLWLHNTYEHPLAPILDVAGALTGGAAIAGRAAGAVGAVGELAAGAEADAAISTAADSLRTAAASRGPVAFRGPVDHTPFATGAKLGSESTASNIAAHSPGFARLQKFSNPAGYALKTYTKLGEKLGYTGDALTTFARAALDSDPAARRLLVGTQSGGLTAVKDLSKNPWTRARQAALGKAADKVVEKAPVFGKVMGSARAFEKWAHLDTGQRRAALSNVMHAEFVGITKMGEVLTKNTAAENVALIAPTMRDALVSQAHHLTPAGLPGSPELAKQIEDLTTSANGGAKFQLVRDHNHPSYTEAMTKAMNAVDLADQAGKKAAGFETFFRKDWSAANVTSKPEEALRDANGNFRVVSKSSRIQDEAIFSSRVVKMFYTNPTKVWRYAILGASPRYFVNNFVGNGFMLMAATDPVSMFKAFRSYIHLVHGQDVARTAEDQILNDIRGHNWVTKHFGGEYGFARSNTIDPLTGLPTGNKFDVALGKLPNLHGVTHRYADLPYRHAAVVYSMKRMVEYQQAYAKFRDAGMGHWAAERKAAESAAESPAVRTLVRQQVNNMLGQYHTYTRLERGVRSLVPFYAWDRAIVVHMRHLIVSQPYKVAMGAAIGTLGTLKTQEIMGNVPDFLRSAIPAKLLTGPLGIISALIGQNKNQRMGVMNAMSLSPYGTIGDLTNLAMNATGLQKGKLTTGETLGATLNPFIQSAAQELSGTSLQTGFPVKPPSGGPIVGLYTSTFGSIPEATLLEGLLGHEGSSTTKAGKPTLYEKNLQASLSSFLGLPIRQVSLQTAHTFADQQAGIKRPKPKKLNYPGV